MVHFSPQEVLSDDYIMTLKVILNCIVSFMNERHRIMWHRAQNVVSLRVWYKFVNFNWTYYIHSVLVQDFYQVSPYTWTNHITTCRYHDSLWYCLIQQARPDTKSCTTTLCI